MASLMEEHGRARTGTGGRKAQEQETTKTMENTNQMNECRAGRAGVETEPMAIGKDIIIAMAADGGEPDGGEPHAHAGKGREVPEWWWCNERAGKAGKAGTDQRFQSKDASLRGRSRSRKPAGGGGKQTGGGGKQTGAAGTGAGAIRGRKCVLVGGERRGKGGRTRQGAKKCLPVGTGP